MSSPRPRRGAYYVKDLREEELRLRGEISNAMENLSKARKKRKNLITIVIVAIVALAMGVGIVIALNSFSAADSEIVEYVEE